MTISLWLLTFIFVLQVFLNVSWTWSFLNFNPGLKFLFYFVKELKGFKEDILYH